MDFQPNTSLHLSSPSNHINLALVLETSSSSSSSPVSPSESRVFSCNYCERKFYSSQALGGHQNAHKLERTLAKKSRELSSAVRSHGEPNQRSGSYHLGHEPTRTGIELHGRPFRYSGDMAYSFGSRDLNGYRAESPQEDISKLDLSLRL